MSSRTVRELILELATIEDEIRRLPFDLSWDGDSASADLLSLTDREQRILHELHERSDTPADTQVTVDLATATAAATACSDAPAPA